MKKAAFAICAVIVAVQGYGAYSAGSAVQTAAAKVTSTRLAQIEEATK